VSVDPAELSPMERKRRPAPHARVRILDGLVLLPLFEECNDQLVASGLHVGRRRFHHFNSDSGRSRV
jgi:hypothetical protein